MTVFLNQLVDTLTKKMEGIQAIYLGGSKQNNQKIDLWSDYDISIVLSPETEVMEQEFIQVINKMGVIVGSEIYSEHHYLLYRAILYFQQSIEIIDAALYTYDEWSSKEYHEEQTLLFGDMETQAKSTISLIKKDSFHLDESQINPTWFKYFITIKKFCRNDNLIGMHLLLDLIREYLILEMIERDQRQGTNIHRWGYNETLPAAIKLTQIDETKKESLLDYIAKLAYEYDQKSASQIMNYKSRYPMVKDYIESSKQYLKNKEI